MILEIKRYFVGDPNMVSIVTDDDLATITADNYLVTQQEQIEEINHGQFQWKDNDMVIISFGDNETNFFRRDAENQTFVALQPEAAP